MFTFRRAGPSGRGEGRVRFYVDLDMRYIGSIEGKSGDYTLDSDRIEKMTRYKTRDDAAAALAALTHEVRTPPVDKVAYAVLTSCRGRTTPLTMPSLSLARMLAARGHLVADDRKPSFFRLTRSGTDIIRRYEEWLARETKPTEVEHT